LEKIQKAIEKAREQRQQTVRAAAVAVVDDRLGVERSAGSTAHDRSSTDGPASITYKQTRVVATEEPVLLDRRVVAGLLANELSETFRILRTHVLQRMHANGYTTIAITSAGRGEGKTLTAVNLAASIAMDINHTVLLVDADLRRPSLHTYFGMEPDVGLADYLLHDAAVSRCLVNPGIPRLVILPAGRSLLQSSELLSSPKMVDLAEELKRRYTERIVVYDLAPLLLTGDALVFLRHVDCCLLVIEEGRTQKADIGKSLELLDGCNVIGTVLNKSSSRLKTYV
jgi:exopolysaccharide/PEP-CTERM locus tyrosine autokinase